MEALEKIDFSNRLPRGKSYARTGKVKYITIKGGQISAKVQGSRPSPYQVKISLPQFKNEQHIQVVNAVLDNPLIHAKLLNRQLPSELYELLTKRNINLFPTKWADVRGDCSCPDWAVPCKHLAAVIYMVANAIDQRPETVFELRGLELLGIIAVRRGGGAVQSSMEFVNNQSWFVNKITVEKSTYASDSISNQFDVTTIAQVGEKLIHILSDQPPFGDKDFKVVLLQVYKKVGREIQRITTNHRLIGDTKITIPTEPKGVMNEQWKWVKWTHKDEQRPPTSQLWIEQLRMTQIGGYDRYVSGWVQGRQLAMKLLAQGAMIPRLVQVAQQQFRIQWVGAQMEPNVKRLVEQLKDTLPVDLITVEDQKGRIRYLKPEEQVHWLVSIWIERWLNILVPAQLANTPIGELFFKQAILKSDRFETQHLPSAIQLWLQKWHLTSREWMPTVHVTEQNDRFAINIAIKNSQQPMKPPVILSEFLTSKHAAPLKTMVLQDIALLADLLPQLGPVINSRGTEVALFDNQSIVPVLIDVLPAIQMLGIPLIAPNGLMRMLRPKASVKISSTAGSNRTFAGLEQMLEFDWQVAIGDTCMSKQEFAQLFGQARGIVRFKDQFVYLEQNEVAKLIKALEKPQTLSQVELLRAGLLGQYRGAKVELTPQTQALLEQLLVVPTMPVPAGVRADLRPYQQRGWAWLYHNARLGFGSLLADDMGLGKTLQIITLLWQWKKDLCLQNNPALVVVPTTLLTNWVKEIAKFAPELKVHVYHGSGRKLPKRSVDVLLTTYGLLRSDLKSFQSMKWTAVIIDEAQNIKNAATAQTKAVKQLRADTHIALTGTPVENRLSEYWSIFEFLNPGYLGSQAQFETEFAKPIEIERNHDVVQNFRKITEPFVRRRLKTDKSIIADLPDKIVTDQYCQLTVQQVALYQSLVEKTMKTIEQSETPIERAGLVFKLMTGIKQICNHPAHYVKQGVAKVDDSGKTMLLLELLQTIEQSQQKVIIFTQYTQMGELLVSLLNEKLGYTPLFFHGSLSRNVRDELVNRFQEIPQERVMILSLKAGGTGLNLTAANHVIHYDLWWNPAVEAQATDRAYRIGQQHNVNVYRLITTGTYEEKINAMIQAKKELADLTVVAGEKWLGELSNRELRDLFRLEK